MVYHQITDTSEGLQIWGGGVFADTVSGSHGQTRPDSGPPVWCLGEELTINEHIKEYYTGPPTWYLWKWLSSKYRMGVLGMYSSGSVWGQVSGYHELGKKISETLQCMQLITHCTVMGYLKWNTSVVAHKQRRVGYPQRKQLARSTENLSVSICILLGQEV